MAHSGVCKRLRTRAAREDFYSRKGAVWLFATLLMGITPSVSAQYGSTGIGPPGGGLRPGDPAPQQSTDPTKPQAAGRDQRSWEIVPTLLVTETYTDNVRLRPSGSERSDWVTELRPGVSIVGRGARLRFDATYAANVVNRIQEGSNDVVHYLNARADAELVQKLLFVDARASVTQQNVSLLGPQAESDISDTGNRTSVRTVLISPYLRRDFGTNAQGEARLTSSSVTSSGGFASLIDSESNRIDLKLASGPAFKLLTWNVAYNKERIDYTETNQSIDQEKIQASGKRLITPELGLLATVGYEENDYGVAGPSAKGRFWSVGPEWTPTPRTRLAATTGRRYFGPSYSLDFSHRTRLTTWRVEYSEDVTTTRGQFLVPTNVDTATFLDALFLSSIPDPIIRQAVIQSFITQFGLPPSLTVPLNVLTTTPFIVKRLRASFGVQGVRNTVLANIFTEDRQADTTGVQGTGDFALTPNVKQAGASVLWTLRITPQTSTNVSVGYTISDFPGLAREDKLTYIRLGLTKQFQPKLTGTLSFRRLQNESNQAGGGYRENAVSAALAMRF